MAGTPEPPVPLQRGTQRAACSPSAPSPLQDRPSLPGLTLYHTVHRTPGGHSPSLVALRSPHMTPRGQSPLRGPHTIPADGQKPLTM